MHLSFPDGVLWTKRIYGPNVTRLSRRLGKFALELPECGKNRYPELPMACQRERPATTSVTTPYP
jgi:hypothetical protein